MSAPQPNTPEGQRAAQKVRNIFYFIAAANIVLVAIVMWPRPKPTEEARKAQAPASAPEEYKAPESSAVKEMEAAVDRVLAAYKSRDAERFAAEFSSQAIPPVNENYFRTVVIGLYQEEFGDVHSRKLTGETNPDPDRGMLVYEITCKKGLRAKISANFARESGKLRLMQWRMEKM